jgi:hypothetical protein
LPYEGEFSSCPKDELWQCWFYEFARELPDYHKRVKAWRTSKGAQTDSKLTELLLFGAVFLFMDEWPETPYLKIPAKKRGEYPKQPRPRNRLYPLGFEFLRSVGNQQALSATHLLKQLESSNGCLAPSLLTELKTFLAAVEKNPAGLISMLGEGRNKYGWPIVQHRRSPAMVLLSVPWSLCSTELADAFLDFVNKYRPKGGDFAPVETRGRGQENRLLEDLKALEAYRHCPGHSFEKQTVFATKRNWKRAMARVEKILSKFPWENPRVIRGEDPSHKDNDF